MSTVDFRLPPELSVIGKEEEQQEELNKNFVTGAESEEKKERDSLEPPSNTTQPFLAAVRDEDLENGGSAQCLGLGSRFQSLPEDLEEHVGNRVFECEDDLETALEELMIADEKIVLGDDGKAYLYMPGDVHNAATGHIANSFTTGHTE